MIDLYIFSGRRVKVPTCIDIIHLGRHKNQFFRMYYVCAQQEEGEYINYIHTYVQQEVLLDAGSMRNTK